MKSTMWAAVAVAVAVLAGGCGSAAEPEVGTPPQVADPNVSAYASPAAAGGGVQGKTENLKLGQVVTVPAGGGYPGFSVVAQEYRSVNEYGMKADGVRVRFCAGAKVAGADQPQVTHEPWALVYNNGESTHDEIGYSEQLKPSYPDWSNPRTVQPGKCVAGWIPFRDIDGKPQAVQYSNDAVTASWKLP